MIVTNVGMGCGGRGSVVAQAWWQGGPQGPWAIERRVNERRFPLRPGLRWMCTCHWSIRAKMVGCGRPSRVVLAPVASVKFVDAREPQPGLAMRLNPQTTVTKTNSSPGRSRS